MKPKKPTSEKRKASRERYENKTDFKPLSVRVHTNRREIVKEYALKGKCPNYERVIKMLNEKISCLEDLVRSYQNEN